MHSKADAGSRTSGFGLGVLPIEVWEEIIDHCPPDVQQGVRDYGTLRSCALVCSAWLPRSRRNLLREVRLGTAAHVDLLLGLLTERPNLGELVTVIHVWDNLSVPFARSPLPHLVPNCRRLLVDIGWGGFPRGYPKLVAEYGRLEELVLRLTEISAEDVLHIVSSLSLLTSLTLLDGPSALIQSEGRRRKRFLGEHKPESGRGLQQLSIKSFTASPVLGTQGFPPQGSFGHSVTQLELLINGDTDISRSLVECISDFRKLSVLDLVIIGYAAHGHHEGNDLLLQILLHVQSGQHFRRLRVWLTAKRERRRVLYTYGTTRRGFLNILCGAEMQKWFPSLEVFFFSFLENDHEHTAQWWTERILNRLPALRNALQIELRVVTRQDTWFLWDPVGLARYLGS